MRHTVRPTVHNSGRVPRHRTLGVAAASTAAALTAAMAGFAAPASAAPPTTPFISEIHYDNNGTDSGEFVEVELPPGTTSSGWSIVLYNGTGGAVYDTDALPAVTAPAGSSAVAVVSYPANGIQNGSPDGIALVAPGGVVAEFLSYEGPMTAVGGPANGLTSTDIGVSEGGAGPVGESLSRRLNPATTNVEWQASGLATQGQVNPPLVGGGPGGDCSAAPTHEIGAVQGTGFSTPLAAQVVTVRGVVVADVPGLGGFSLQDADGDGTATTSDGVFVASSTAVGLGDVVQVTGTPSESFGETRITATTAAVCTPAPADPTTALPAATPLDLPADDATNERLEGMRVSPVDVLTVSEVFDLTRFGELTLSEGGLLVQPTELGRPGPAAQAVATQNALRHLILDDGTNASTSATNRPYLSPTTPVRVGDQVTITAPVVLGYGFGSWRLQPADGTPAGTFTPGNSRPVAPDAVGGDITVASFNVLNYFLTFTGPDARGATSQAELDEQAGKIVPAIRALGADIVVLQEVEDTNSTGYGDGTPDLALAELVGRLNTAEGSTVWASVPLPDELLAVDRDVIRVAIIYRIGAVTPVGDPVGLVDETVWSNAREPIAQTFVAEGDTFTVVANHLKSKSPGSPTGDNVDSGDGQGEWNGDRVRQVQSLLTFVAQLQASTGDTDVLLMGDFNSYTQEDPIEALRQAGYTDLGTQFDPARYSYVFDELSGSLDHGLATASLLAKVTEAVHWNINSVESFSYQYTGDPALYAPNPYRSSDHDPLVIGLDLGTPGPTPVVPESPLPALLTAGALGVLALAGFGRRALSR